MENSIFLITISIYLSAAADVENIAFVILSQNNDYNAKLSKALKEDLKNQCSLWDVKAPKIYVSNEDFNVGADWTIFPLISPILDVAGGHTKWIIIVENRTKVFVGFLLERLGKYNHSQEIWIGHALHDSEATIIHHFAFFRNPSSFDYPNLASGIAVSVPLLKRLKERLTRRDYEPIDFHIDPAHEFALFVYGDGAGTALTHDASFCVKKMADGCATYPEAFRPCGRRDASSIYFAVKTCRKFHQDRVEVIKRTWGRHVAKVTFFSDAHDENVPTVRLDVANTERGHCAKTMSILEYVEEEIRNSAKIRWVALVDDDTILSASRLAGVASCHVTARAPLLLGERYRFARSGLDYVTGGAGALLNRAALARLARACACPRPDSPDDMVLGWCAGANGVDLVHVPQMHQGRPVDYAAGRLAPADAVSFHKHWMIDPIDTYRRWFEPDDEKNAEEARPKSEL